MTPNPNRALRPVRDIENAWIPLSDGARLSARIWLPADAEQRPGARDPRVPPVPQGRRHRRRRTRSRHPYFAAHGYASVRVDLRGSGDSDGRAARRVPAAGAGRRARGPRLARRAALVHRRGRHDRLLVGRLQRPAGRRAPAAAAQGGHHGVLDRRPLRRRLPLHGRLPARLRHAQVGVVDARLQRAGRPTRASSASGWREQWLERLEARPRLARDWLVTPAPRRVLAARLDRRGLLGDRGARCSRSAAGPTPTPTPCRGCSSTSTCRGSGSSGRGAHMLPAPGVRRAGDRLPAGVRCAGGTAGSRASTTA